MAESAGAVRKLDTDPPRHNIRMTADRILVMSPKELGERRTRGGILIPATVDSEAKKAVWGEVVAVGPLVRSAETGDLVLFGPESAYELEIRGEEYIVLKERDIHAVASGRTEGGTGLYL
ncbi:MAG TPA: co-chaperone GroES [Actinomycetota bacterium]|nr:co-chaperone GroES [Actinomycetota bacterium]